MCQLRLWRLQPCYWRKVQSLMRYAQHLFVNIAILEKIVQHPDLHKGLCTYPTLVCEDCKASTPIVSSYACEIHSHAVNLRSSLAKVAIGESHSSFETFCCFKGEGGGGRERGGDTIFVKKKLFYIYISFCTSMPVLFNFQIWKHLDTPF